MKTEKRPYQSHQKTTFNLPVKKKALGQHFLRKQSVVDNMIDAVEITKEISVMEIGCGDGFLTDSILVQTPCKKLVVYEIDPEWASFVQRNIGDKRLDLRLQNILDVDWEELRSDTPLVMLANLPYQITFPILFRIMNHKHLFNEGVVMVQEEVAQKIVATSGKKYGPTSLLLQYHFEFKLLEKVEPSAFTPPPKVHSRLIYFKPRLDIPVIEYFDSFWKFVQGVFTTPRQTLRNNLRRTHYSWQQLDEETLKLRAQQLSLEDLLLLWEKVQQKA